MENSEIFIEALRKGDKNTVEEMLDKQPELVNARSAQGLSAVLTAIYYGQNEMARILTQRGASLDVFEASAVGDFARVQKLVNADPELAYAFSSDGFQPLGLAAFFGNTDVAAYLLSQGAPVNEASQNRMKVMPLHSSVASQNLPITRLLLAAGADANARQQDDFAPLHEAAQNGQIEMIVLLLEYGADRTAKMKDGKTPYDIAIESNHPEAANFFR